MKRQVYFFTAAGLGLAFVFLMGVTFAQGVSWGHAEVTVSVLVMTAVLVLLILAPVAVTQSGGIYELVRSKPDGGMMNASGESFRLGGTIGQPDSGALSGGSYSVYGGFWGSASPESSYAIYLPLTVKGP